MTKQARNDFQIWYPTISYFGESLFKRQSDALETTVTISDIPGHVLLSCESYGVRHLEKGAVNSGAARARAMGMIWPWNGSWSNGSLTEMKTSHFSSTLVSNGPTRALLGPLEPPLSFPRLHEPLFGIKLTLADPAWTLQIVYFLFSWDVDSKMLQLLVVWIENGPPWMKKVWTFTLSPPGCATDC